MNIPINTLSGEAFPFLSPISISAEYVKVLPQKTEQLDYYVTEFPRIENDITDQFSFIYSFFESKPAITRNQPEVLTLANKLFEGSRPLSAQESAILDKTFLRLAKNKPTRPNRI